MTIRDKLIEILDRNFGYTEEEPAEVVADRLINSGLIMDNKVYLPKYAYFDEVFAEDVYKCTKCGEYVFVWQPYCANCGAKLKEQNNEKNS